MNHHIGKTSLDIRAPRTVDGFALQTEVSDWFWQNLLPELGRALDAAVPTDVVLRLERLDIELKLSKTKHWQAVMTPSVCRAIVEEIMQRRLFPRPTDAVVLELPLTENGFVAWLSFIEIGQKPFAIGDFEIWQKDALDAVASSAVALSTLKRTLANDPLSIERLIRQHDAVFLGQLLEAITGKSVSELKVWQKTFEVLLRNDGFRTALSLSKFDNRAIHLAFWQPVFEKILRDAQVFDYQKFAMLEFLLQLIAQLQGKTFSKADLMERLLYFFQQKLKEEGFLQAERSEKDADTEGGLLKIHQEEVTTKEGDKSRFKAEQIRNQELKKRVAQNAFLRNEWMKTLKPLPESERLAVLFEPVVSEVLTMMERKVSRGDTPLEQAKIKTKSMETALNPSDKKEGNVVLKTNVNRGKDVESTAQTNEQYMQHVLDQEKDWTNEQTFVVGESIYVGMSGVVLLHPFIHPFFEELGLLDASDFKDETARRRGVGLLQYLTVGEADVVEYDAALLKLLCALPFETPIDSRIELTDIERKEVDELLSMVIKHWGALGDVGVDSLRQGFLQRDGKLSKRSDGWLLQIEKQTMDILLDRLPWGFGVVKLPWQADMLFVEW